MSLDPVVEKLLQNASGVYQFVVSTAFLASLPLQSQTLIHNLRNVWTWGTDLTPAPLDSAQQWLAQRDDVIIWMGIVIYVVAVVALSIQGEKSERTKGGAALVLGLAILDSAGAHVWWFFLYSLPLLALLALTKRQISRVMIGEYSSSVPKLLGSISISIISGALFAPFYLLKILLGRAS